MAKYDKLRTVIVATECWCV